MALVKLREATPRLGRKAGDVLEIPMSQAEALVRDDLAEILPSPMSRKRRVLASPFADRMLRGGLNR